jgi:hypothetical protein
MTMSALTALGLVWRSGEDTMGIPIEIPPFPDVVLTLSAMLALFAYVYRLAGKEGPPQAGLDEIKCMNSDATVTPSACGAGMNDTPTTP